MQKDIEDTVAATKHLAVAYKNFIRVINYMWNKYEDNEALRKIRNEVRECSSRTAMLP